MSISDAICQVAVKFGLVSNDKTVRTFADQTDTMSLNINQRIHKDQSAQVTRRSLTASLGTYRLLSLPEYVRVMHVRS